MGPADGQGLSTPNERVAVALPAAAVFIGAFLLFQLQPLVGKTLLPWFGGSAAVWTTCVLFFQVGLLLGYAYAHLSIRWLSPGRQVVLHVLLLVVGCAFLPAVPDAAWKIREAAHPVARILLMLTATAGLPYFVLAATGPLMQAWFGRLAPGRSPYPLYALSNAGSLAGLLAYPFVVEVWLKTRNQALLWAAGYILFALLASATAWFARKPAGAESRPQAEPLAPVGATGAPPRPGWRAGLWWSMPAACASVAFLAVTNQLCLSAASVPFLWVLPLGVYLVSFIVTFSGERAYPRMVLLALFIPLVSVTAVIIPVRAWVPGVGQVAIGLIWQILIYTTTLFVICLICHGELYRLRPEPARLTAFYLSVAAGGALGGVLVGLVAPSVFVLYQELYLALVGACVLVFACLYRDRLTGRLTGWLRWIWVVPAVYAVWLAFFLWVQTQAIVDETVLTRRNFYGVTKVLESDSRRTVVNGNTTHGYQYLAADRRDEPTAYYAKNSGVGLVLQWYGRRPALRVGVVGLGAGTLAAYCRAGDLYRFYELNPQMRRIAFEQFGFLGACTARGGRVEVIPGDARLSLEAELEDGTAPGYDVLVLDAFSSDAVPVHLLTAEAFAVYLRHLRPDGTIVVHVTNTHINLAPPLFGLAAHLELEALSIKAVDELGAISRWIVMTRNREMFDNPEMRQRQAQSRPSRSVPLWTDDYSNLFSVLK